MSRTLAAPASAAGPWLVIGFTVLFAPSFASDETIFFNYINNVTAPSWLYFYNGYVHVIPELVAAIASPLPFAWQALGYRLVTVAVIGMLYIALARLFRHGSPAPANALALACVLGLRSLEPIIFGCLSPINFSAFLLASVVWMRATVEDRPLSWPAVAAIALAGVSSPWGILLAAASAAHLRRDRWRADNVRHLALAVAITSAFAWIMANTSREQSLLATPRALWAALLDPEPDMRVSTMVAALAAMVLLAAGVRALIAWFAQRDDLATRLDLRCAYIGLGTLAVYLISDRLAWYGGVPSRYALPATLCAMIVIASAVLRIQPLQRRTIAALACLGVTGAITAYAMRDVVRGTTNDAVSKHRFLVSAAEFRKTCTGGAMVHHDDRWSPVVLCRPQALSVGVHPIQDFTPWTGPRVQTPRAPEDRPAVHVFEPILQSK